MCHASRIPTSYRHIDSIFTDVVDWQLIHDHWPDLMQVAISIEQGRVSSLLLRKLSAEGRNNRRFHASRELGCVLRTIYLLRWIGSKEMRQEVTGTTNKIESCHAFTKWLNFGGDVTAENDPVEQQKRLRYIDLVASAVILQLFREPCANRKKRGRLRIPATRQPERMETPGTTTTPYGLLDTRALNEAEQSFDTRAPLKMVEELDRFTIPARQDGGLRNQLLRLHGMSHSVINGARLSAPTGESLPELATAILFDQHARQLENYWVARITRMPPPPRPALPPIAGFRPG